MMNFAMRLTLNRLLLVGLIALGSQHHALGQGEVTFTGADDSNYDNDLNWVGASGMLVPEGQFEEFAAIGSNTPDPLTTNTFPIATADLTGSSPPSVGRLLIGFGGGTEGTLNVSGTGFITTSATDGGLAGDLVVGANGTGTLNVSTTGGVMSDLFDVRPTGTARITGPDATINAGGLLVSGALVAEITNATTHSVINVTGQAGLTGRLDVDLSALAPPSIGDSWELIEADSLEGSFSSINLIGSTALTPGSGLSARTVDNGSTTSLELVVEQFLTLQVNRSNGSLTIQNTGPAVAASNVSIDGYAIRSASNALDPANGSWNSLDDQNVGGADVWREGNPSAGQLSETQAAGATTIAGQDTLSLGNGFAGPTEFGATEDLVFQYTGLDGVVRTGLIDYTGNANTLVLQIDPATGEARVTNQSQFSVDIDGYTITSTDEALLTTWNSLDDQNGGGGDWGEANPSAGRLSETKQAGALTLNNGNSFNLGSLYDTVGGSGDGDVTFEFLINDGLGGQSIAALGEVIFETIMAGALPGDFNNDNIVDARDYAVWRDNLGAGDESSLNGNGDGMNGVDTGDYTLWRSAFGNSSGAASALASTAVPEPAASFFVTLAALGLGLLRNRGVSKF